MSPALIGVLMFALMTVLILAGIPLAISMLVSSAVGFYAIGGLDVLTIQFTNGILTTCANYSFAVIPLFMVMGALCTETGIGEGTFTAAKKWLGNLRGGLLDAVVIANMIFGACSGVSAAGNIVFSRIALPELDRNGYDRGLSLGTITCAGSLSVLIPPSMPILVFALMTGVSVGNALIAGISTGVVFAVLMLIVVNVLMALHPEKIPPRNKERVPVKEKLATLKLLLPIFALFALVVGGSFAGWFPATVGGAVAMVAVFFYAVCIRLSFKRIWNCIWDGLKGFGNIYLIVISGTMIKRSYKDLEPYFPVGHFGVTCKRYHGTAETGARKFWIGISEFEPGGGADWAYDDNPLEKVYFVLEGQMTVTDKDGKKYVIGPMESISFPPNEGRGLKNETDKPAKMLVIINYPEK